MIRSADGALGGGLYTSADDAVITSCIFWANKDSSCTGGSCSESAQIKEMTFGSTSVTYTCIQNLSTFTVRDAGRAGQLPLLDESLHRLSSPR